MLTPNTSAIIQELTKLFIPQYFVLENTNTWIPRDELFNKIEKKMENIINLLNNTVQLYDDDMDAYYNVPSSLNSNINSGLDNFFNDPSVKSILEQKITDTDYMYEKRNHEKVRGKGKFSKVKSNYNLDIINELDGSNALFEAFQRQKPNNEFWNKFKNAKEIATIAKTYLQDENNYYVDNNNSDNESSEYEDRW